ncbi:MAPEG family protein [Spongiibacter taiwanensis]|uniref:MAPEG family protein n=1 Tax=Spongiibacter taiwanensis TaxID=1748242 RepID=UPI002035525D|nr:MAPEG family protein [Spongiibacter taiwanensis]USA41971.1 MAPEG family protein [Spongiibacter taiwanensis]
MTIAFWCVFVACLLPVMTAWVSGWFRHRQFGGIDNRHPRQQCARLEGPGARSVAAQQNAWEALAVFTAAVLVADAVGVAQHKMDIAALVFIAARVVYPVFYIADLHVLRSLTFMVGFFASLSLFIMAA